MALFNSKPVSKSFSMAQLRDILEIPSVRSPLFIEAIPFSADDATAGSETELQAAVSGRRDAVDLCLTIDGSNYIRNINKRAKTGDTSESIITDLEKYLDENSENIWENSWVRFPMKALGTFATEVLNSDLLRDKQKPSLGLRKDCERFIRFEQGERLVRVPVSYLLKLSLAEVVSAMEDLHPVHKKTALGLMGNFLSDNTSPETTSFHVVPCTPGSGLGRSLARETSKRFLLSHLLIEYANRKFGLTRNGQKAFLYFSPHPPVRQRQLNECISDSFYRELFMSPCLSGWNNGEAKHAYMCLCHQVLSRSQLNAVAKLREAGIITRNLVVLPNMSNISLANNGTHISIGSRKLSGLGDDGASGFNAAHEKYLGDMVIKIVEHFLPLFVGTYTAAPYRIDFSEFHPERVLGFLPHELDYTHLRMLWRRWKKKAVLKIFGNPMTPFGVKRLDNLLSTIFRARGDFVNDFRLLDYPVSLMSTERSYALDGTLGNEDRLKKDLSDLGVFDGRMSLYLLYRLRAFSPCGFSGFEGRHYSLFESISHDMTHAANLQILITALAFKYALGGTWNHFHIPSDPFSESERRQIIFGPAVGIPTFYVHEQTKNLFLKHIVKRTKHVRYSRRYRHYLRVYGNQFLQALLDILRSDAADLIEAFGIEDTMKDLAERLDNFGNQSVSAKLTKGILNKLGTDNPLKATALEFNSAAEQYYRTALLEKNIDEAFDFLRQDCRNIGTPDMARLFGNNPDAFPADWQNDLKNEKMDLKDLQDLIQLLLISIHGDKIESEKVLAVKKPNDAHSASIYRSKNGEDPHRAALLG